MSIENYDPPQRLYTPADSKGTAVMRGRTDKGFRYETRDKINDIPVRFSRRQKKMKTTVRLEIWFKRLQIYRAGIEGIISGRNFLFFYRN